MACKDFNESIIFLIICDLEIVKYSFMFSELWFLSAYACCRLNGVSYLIRLKMQHVKY